MPLPEDEEDELVTEFGDVRLRSTVRIVAAEPGVISFEIEGPIFEFTDDDTGEEA